MVTFSCSVAPALAAAMAASTSAEYWGILAAARISDGLVVASLGHSSQAPASVDSSPRLELGDGLEVSGIGNHQGAGGLKLVEGGHGCLLGVRLRGHGQEDTDLQWWHGVASRGGSGRVSRSGGRLTSQLYKKICTIRLGGFQGELRQF